MLIESVVVYSYIYEHVFRSTALHYNFKRKITLISRFYIEIFRATNTEKTESMFNLRRLQSKIYSICDLSQVNFYCEFANYKLQRQTNKQTNKIHSRNGKISVVHFRVIFKFVSIWMQRALHFVEELNYELRNLFASVE